MERLDGLVDELRRSGKTEQMLASLEGSSSTEDDEEDIFSLDAVWGELPTFYDWQKKKEERPSSDLLNGKIARASILRVEGDCIHVQIEQALLQLSPFACHPLPLLHLNFTAVLDAALVPHHENCGRTADVVRRCSRGRSVNSLFGGIHCPRCCLASSTLYAVGILECSSDSEAPFLRPTDPQGRWIPDPAAWLTEAALAALHTSSLSSRLEGGESLLECMRRHPLSRNASTLPLCVKGSGVENGVTLLTPGVESVPESSFYEHLKHRCYLLYAKKRTETATALIKASRDEEALSHLHVALQWAPQYADALIAKSAALSNLHKPMDALRLLNRVLETDPDNVEAVCLKEAVQRKLGITDKPPPARAVPPAVVSTSARAEQSPAVGFEGLRQALEKDRRHRSHRSSHRRHKRRSEDSSSDTERSHHRRKSRHRSHRKRRRRSIEEEEK